MIRHILTIGHHDLRVFFRSRTSWIWLFLMPTVFVYFMALANRAPGGPAAPRPTVRIDSADEGFLGAALLQELSGQGLNVDTSNRTARADRVLHLPPDFTARVLTGGQSRATFSSLPAAGDGAAALVEARLIRALVRLNAQLAEQAAATPGIAPTAEALEALRSRPALVRLESSFAGRRPIPSGFQMSLPGVLVMYLLMNLLIFGGVSVAWERRYGVLRRLLVHPVRRPALILGKVYGLLLLGAAQSTFLLAVGHWGFGVNFGADLGGILLTLLVYGWMCASLGVLVGSLVQSEDRVVGVSILTSLTLAALGGCWWPLELVPPTFQTVAHLLPTGWAMTALHQLITFGSGVSAALPAIGAVAGFAVAANLLAMRFFRT